MPRRLRWYISVPPPRWRAKKVPKTPSRIDPKRFAWPVHRDREDYTGRDSNASGGPGGHPRGPSEHPLTMANVRVHPTWSSRGAQPQLPCVDRQTHWEYVLVMGADATASGVFVLQSTSRRARVIVRNSIQTTLVLS